MDVREEKRLVEAARNGHLESFAALYERYYGSMVALAYSVVADRHLAEDSAQQSFAIACRDLSKLKSKDKFAAWLAGICRNTAKGMLRSKGRVAALNEAVAAESEVNKEHPGDVVRRVIWELGAVDREPIVLRYYNGLSYEQISEVLGISSQAVHGRLTRAKRKIEKQLKRDGFTGAKL